MGRGLRRWWAVPALVMVMMISPSGNGSSAEGATSPFEDVPSGDAFAESIAWLANQKITLGCNPPDNTQFCPEAPVTRGQMAAFLTRALYLPSVAGLDRFVDDDDSVFEDSIERLAASGITKGCNPPENDRFCPDDHVTRGQMAAFLVRAFGYQDSGSKSFVDDDGSVFEGAIERLAEAGVTVGCNPPVNDRFCPDDRVTRGQMAAFLRRAFGNPAIDEPGLNRIDPEHTLLPTVNQVTFQAFDPEGQSVLTFKGKADVGDVIVMGITPETPHGFVGKVIAVSGNTVTTEPGSIMDAIPESKGEIAIDLTSGHLSQQGLQFRPIRGVGVGCGTLDADLNFDRGTLHMAWDWGWLGGLKRLEVWFDPVLEAKILALAARPNCDVDVDLVRLPPMITAFMIGPVPVAITHEMKLGLNLSYSGDGSDVRFAGLYRASLDIGANFTGALGTPILRNVKLSADVPQGGWGDSGSRTAEAFFNVAYDAKAYGLLGLSAKAGPYVNATVRTSAPCLRIDGGVAATIEGVAGIGPVMVSVDLGRTNLLRKTLMTRQCTTPPPSGSSPATNVSLHIDHDSDTIFWRIEDYNPDVEVLSVTPTRGQVTSQDSEGALITDFIGDTAQGVYANRITVLLRAGQRQWQQEFIGEMDIVNPSAGDNGGWNWWWWGECHVGFRESGLTRQTFATVGVSTGGIGRVEEHAAPAPWRVDGVSGVGFGGWWLGESGLKSKTAISPVTFTFDWYPDAEQDEFSTQSIVVESPWTSACQDSTIRVLP